MLRGSSGVGVLAGTDARGHWRIVLEELLEEGCGHFDDDPLAVIDVDLKNVFPFMEWACIRDAVAEEPPALLPWTSRAHRAPSTVILPSGQPIVVDRGARQGGPSRRCRANWLLRGL